MTTASHSRIHPGVYVLAITAFAIGVAEFVVVGVLPAIATDLDVPIATTGSLVGLYALAVALGTPFIVLGLGAFPKKAALLALVAIFLVGNLISAFSTSFPTLLGGRIVTALAHGSFLAMGTTAAVSLAPKEQASKTIAIMFAGLTLAMVIGVPLGSFLGNAMGWRLPFYAVAVLAVLSFLATLFWLPKLPARPTADARTQLAALGNPAIWTMMSVTVIGFGASFAAFTFIVPILTDITGFTQATASLLLVVFGAATVVGNLAGGRLSDALGWFKALRLLFVLLTLTLAVLAVSLPYQGIMVAVVFAWGVVAFGMTPAFQSGMIETAERNTPKAVDFATGLNISSFNLGITLGETVGSALVRQGHMNLTPWAGVLAAIAVQLPLLLLARSRTAVPQSAQNRLAANQTDNQLG